MRYIVKDPHKKLRFNIDEKKILGSLKDKWTRYDDHESFVNEA